jgi:hypothetical protein
MDLSILITYLKRQRSDIDLLVSTLEQAHTDQRELQERRVEDRARLERCGLLQSSAKEPAPSIEVEANPNRGVWVYK